MFMWPQASIDLIVLQILSKKVTSDQLSFLINGLIEALSDGQSHSSSGACVVLNSLFRIRGAELGGEVGNIYCSWNFFSI